VGQLRGPQQLVAFDREADELVFPLREQIEDVVLRDLVEGRLVALEEEVDPFEREYFVVTAVATAIVARLAGHAHAQGDQHREEREQTQLLSHLVPLSANGSGFGTSGRSINRRRG
jgi:hypothetical protein